MLNSARTRTTTTVFLWNLNVLLERVFIASQPMFRIKLYSFTRQGLSPVVESNTDVYSSRRLSLHFPTVSNWGPGERTQHNNGWSSWQATMFEEAGENLFLTEQQ